MMTFVQVVETQVTIDGPSYDYTCTQPDDRASLDNAYDSCVTILL